MALAIITLVLLGITLISFLIGTVWLAKYAFRLSVGHGLAVLLFPPYTFYFAFYQLDVDAKDRPTALWMFGLVASILLVLIFSGPLGAAARGDFAALAAPVEEVKQKVDISQIADPTPPEPVVETPPAAVLDASDAGVDAAGMVDVDAGTALVPDAAGETPGAGTEAPAATP